MVLRQLAADDAPLMLEWMHDDEINKWFCFNAKGMTYDDAIQFVKRANESDVQDYHYAIVGDDDEYLGTISLKHVDLTVKSAEYAISLRKKAQGTGVGVEATRRILQKAFEELMLQRVYLNVLTDNMRAVHFYEKCGFTYEGEFRNHLCLRGKIHSLKWYSMLKDEFELSIF